MSRCSWPSPLTWVNLPRPLNHLCHHGVDQSVKPIRDEHIAEPGLVVVDIAAADRRVSHAVPVHVDPHGAAPALQERGHERPPPVVLDRVDQYALSLPVGPSAIFGRRRHCRYSHSPRL
ncbi:DUF6207 family protein [Streptomyces rishiriensis]|uniref:DUF6207 family protein n=1 Tax=Streptomyces rishiriensis TaxID=68264 RepID=UPI0037AB220D